MDFEIKVKIRSLESFLNEQKEEKDKKELKLDEIDLLFAFLEERINRRNK